MNRKVIVYEMILNPDTNRVEKTIKTTGVFHKFISIIKENDDFVISDILAVVELGDGTVITKRSDLIQFVKPILPIL